MKFLCITRDKFEKNAKKVTVEGVDAVTSTKVIFELHIH